MAKLLWKKSLARAAIATLTTAVIVSGAGISTPQIHLLSSPRATDTPSIVTWIQANKALATSGGRASGGSFGSSGGGSSSSGSSGSSSGGSSSGGSYSGGSSSGGSSHNYSSSDSSGSYSSSGSTYDSGGELLAAMLFGIVGFLVMMYFVQVICEQFVKLFMPQRYRRKREKQRAGLASYKAFTMQQNEQANDTVTVTQVQVALLASAKEVQERFNEIPMEYDFGTPGGLDMALKETVLTLLRSPEAWTHVSTSSKSILTRERAKQHFDQLSIEERSKFEMESLVNVGGKVSRKAIVTKEEGPADYIVATLIVGTAHDQPLFEEIHSAGELKSALKTLGSVPPDYLMVYEMLWSPQDSSDSLTYEELLLNYPHMYQIS
ncbi:MAG: DUF1517 domain-containing protein [Cyanobacteria bacterium J06634_6]